MNARPAVMRAFIVGCCAALAAACATVPDERPVESLFHDGLFAAPSAPIVPADVFALTPQMQAYAHTEIADRLSVRGRRQALIDALYDHGELKLEYDAARTRNAAEAFEARAGNCLSLVIMTAAFAKELGLPVTYNTVFTDETWTRQGNLYLSIGHVNLTLGPSRMDSGRWHSDTGMLTIDFIPGTDLKGAYLHAITEATVLAMYMNNRSAESLAAGKLDDAYAFAREAIRQDARFMPAYNTLGVVYWVHGDSRAAADAFEHVLRREPGNTNAMSNLVLALTALGRKAEAQALQQKLAAIQPNPPFAYFKRGIEAMRIADYEQARRLFAKEIDRAAYYHEFHYWLAVAEAMLGHADEAKRQLALAADTSTTRADHDLYAAKLARIRAHN